MSEEVSGASASEQAVSAGDLWSPNGLPEQMDVWAVWTKRGRRPSYFHATREDAEIQAKRLAVKVPGRKFIVVHLVGKFSVEQDAAIALAGSPKS